MENPFIFGEVVKGTHFTDREKELKTLTLDLASGQNVLLFSPRRYGKTSLILRAMDQLQAKGLLCVYVDFFRATSLQDLGKIYANALTQASASKLQEAVRFIRDHFPAIIPKVIVKGDAPMDIEIDFDAPRRDLDAWLDEIYDMPQKIAERKKKRLVVIFDEFQEIMNLSAEGKIEKRLRAKIQHHDRVAYVFMGSKRHLLDELFLDKNKPLYHIAKSMPLGRIPREKLASFIRARFRSVRLTLRDAELERILSTTQEHPYYTQQLCHEVCNAVSPRKRITLQDVDAAREACLAAQSYAYTTVWEGLSPKQRQVVLGLSKSPGANVYSQDFIGAFDLGSHASVQTAMASLLRKGLVDRENGGYQLSDIFFAEWVRRQIG